MCPTDKARLRELSSVARGGSPSRHRNATPLPTATASISGSPTKIIAELEHSRVPWVQPWGNVKAPLRLPKNAATGRAYSVNVLIL
jgi:hypothetical protein